MPTLQADTCRGVCIPYSDMSAHRLGISVTPFSTLHEVEHTGLYQSCPCRVNAEYEHPLLERRIVVGLDTAISG